MNYPDENHKLYPDTMTPLADRQVRHRERDQLGSSTYHHHHKYGAAPYRETKSAMNLTVQEETTSESSLGFVKLQQLTSGPREG